jgi:hypothetical protein
MNEIDFTLLKYEKLVKTFKQQSYSFLTFEKYCSQTDKCEKTLILRHDVDKKPENSLKVATIEKELGVRSSFYFRAVKKSFKEEIIKKIANLGHEIGYHYEELSLVKGDMNKAINMFEENIREFRKIYPVRTICMHGSPLSKYDNRLLWNNFNYRAYGIIGDPYFDMDFNVFMYLTDTGRRWNNDKVSVRDKIKSCKTYNFKSTADIINNVNKLPEKIMINTHPQRWNDKFFPWIKEMIFQNVKNNIKRYFFVKI